MRTTEPAEEKTALPYIDRASVVHIHDLMGETCRKSSVCWLPVVLGTTQTYSKTAEILRSSILICGFSGYSPLLPTVPNSIQDNITATGVL